MARSAASTRGAAFFIKSSKWGGSGGHGHHGAYPVFVGVLGAVANAARNGQHGHPVPLRPPGQSG